MWHKVHKYFGGSLEWLQNNNQEEIFSLLPERKLQEHNYQVTYTRLEWDYTPWCILCEAHATDAPRFY